MLRCWLVVQTGGKVKTLYQVGKLVALAVVLPNRKRIQKIVYLLKSAGCPIDASYCLHYYGPYSADVASVLNQLVQMKVLVEDELPATGSGRQFKYRLSKSGAVSLAEFEESAPGQKAAVEIERHVSLFRKLMESDLTPLELAATIVFKRQTGLKWDDALADTCSLKRVARTAPSLVEGARLARSIVSREYPAPLLRMN
jgi:uncharacterized protein YwgA